MKQNILGEQKKSNFDDNLADYVNELFDKMPDEVENKNNNVSASEMCDLGDFLVDYSSQDIRMNQKNGIDFLKNSGKALMSAADLYKIASLFFNKCYGVNSCFDNCRKLVDSLNYDLEKGGIMTSTKLTCNFSESSIFHESNQKKIFVIVPNYEWHSVLVSGSLEGISFFNNFFETTDHLDDILKVLVNFAGIHYKSNVQINVRGYWQCKNSKDHSIKSVLFYKQKDDLLIDCTYPSDSGTGGLGKVRGIVYK